MFKQLRNKLLIMNLAMISVLMFIAFTSIYLIMQQNIYADIRGELYRISDIHRDIPPFTDSSKEAPTAMDQDRAPFNMERTLSFSILVDSSDTILSTRSTIDYETTFYNQILEECSSIDLDTNFEIVSEDSQDFAVLKQLSSRGYLYSFLDITQRLDVLQRLIYTFIAVSVVMLAAIFILSNFLTNRSIAPIKTAFDKQKQFISDASHELKTPLAVIRTNVDVLLSAFDSNEQEALSIPDNRKWLTYIRSETERMSQLTNDLLYLTRLDSVRHHPEVYSVFDFSQHIEQHLLGFEVLAYEKGITLDVSIKDHLMIKGNPEQLIQVFVILMDNALKYTPINHYIKVELNESNNHIHLSVTNSGIGIEESERSRIFDRFYRVDKVRTRTTQSHGLGLAIAKSIAQSHHGFLRCDSDGSTFTRFILKLPKNIKGTNNHGSD